MLNELFSWMIGDVTEPDFREKIITRSSLNVEKARADSQRRELFAALYIARRGKSTADDAAISDIARRVSEQRSCLDFITAVEKELGDQQSLNALFFSLKYILDDRCLMSNKEDKINKIFSILLHQDTADALKFFDAHQEGFKPFEQVKLMISSEKTKGHLSKLTTQLRLQNDALSMAHYFQKELEDTERLAAAMLWLVRRNVPIHQIIQTDLLQKLMLLHVAWLDDPDNPVQYFYALLGLFPEAQGLIEEASSVQCEARGFHSYSIRGSLSEQSSLHRVAITAPPLEFSPNGENFDALYSLFGLVFLRDALLWELQSGNEKWTILLHDFLNQDVFVTEQLPALLNFIGVGGEAPLLKVLSGLLDEASVDKLVTQHNGAVLHLLPYHSFLLMKVREDDIALYLREMSNVNNDAGVYLAQLLALLVAFRKVNPAVVRQVFEAIVDLALQHPHFLDDNYLLKQLRKSPEAESILINRYRRLQSHFDRHMTQKVASDHMRSEDYSDIEDLWLSFSRELVLLNEIMVIPNNCPRDKYRLQAHWAKQYFLTHPGAFVMGEYIQALGVSQELLADEVSEYERVLIELLITIDDDEIRDYVISQLDANEVKKGQWMRMEYSDGCLLIQAAAQGNLGLIRWLEPRVVMDFDTIHRVVRGAAEAQQWMVVEYFCGVSSHQPKQHILKDLLILATTSRQIQVVRRLCEGAISHLKTKHIEEVLVRAAVYGYLDLVQYCCQRETCAPSKERVARAFKKAIQFAQHEVVRFIGNMPAHPQLLSVIERELVHRAMKNDLPMVTLLCELLTNTPGQTAIDEAFVKATKFGQLTVARYLYDLPANTLSQKVVEEALDGAIKNGCMDSVQYLCSLSTLGPHPRQGAMNKGVLQAVQSNQLEMVRFFCGLTTRRPTQHSIEKAMLLAIKHDHFSMIDYLGSLVHKKTMLKALQLAAKEGHLPTVRLFCERGPLHRKAIYDARKKAVSYGHQDVVGYLNGLLTPNPICSSTLTDTNSAILVGVSGALDTFSLSEPSIDVVSPERHDRQVLASSHHPSSQRLVAGEPFKRSSSCHNLKTLGLFGHRPKLTRSVSYEGTHSGIRSCPSNIVGEGV
jgi:hypothetical protein